MLAREIKLIDSGLDYYTIEPKSLVLGRMYDNEADEIVVTKPESENNSICTMIITDLTGAVVDHIIMENENCPITSNISQHKIVRIGFCFSRKDGYIKNSEIITGTFLPAQKPTGFVPVEPQQKKNIDYLTLYGFTGSRLEGNELQFFNMNGDKVVSFDLSPFTQEQSDLGETDVSCETFVKGKKTSNLKNDGEDGSSPYATHEWATTLANDFLNKQNYAIVDEEPIDKSTGKMIYQKSKDIIPETIIIDKSVTNDLVSVPSEFAEVIKGVRIGTDEEFKNYVALCSQTEDEVGIYYNLGYLPELNISGFTGIITVEYKINDELKTMTLTQDAEQTDPYFVGDNAELTRTQDTLGGENIPDYFTFLYGTSSGLPKATTDTFTVTSVKKDGVVIYPVAAQFDINNLKIADGDKYNSIKDLMALKAGEGIKIENNVISSTVKIESASEKTLGTIRAWVEDDFICFSTEPWVAFKNKVEDTDILKIQGSQDVSQINGILVLN